MRHNRKTLFWLGVLLAVLGAVRAGAAGGLFDALVPAEAGPTTSPAPPTPEAETAGRPPGVPAAAQEGSVARIVDGDTIWVAVGHAGGPIPVGDDHRVRMLEIDTPETVRPNYPVECGGEDASAFAKAELPVGSRVYLLADKQDKDSFGRYLRYVWDFEGEFYNEKAVATGYAKAVLYPPNDRYIDQMRRAEASAKQEGRGLWGEVCAAAP